MAQQADTCSSAHPLLDPSAEERRTVLVIDDEDGVRGFIVLALERTGLVVLDAPDGQAGVELFRARADAIDAVLLDLTMPRMSGQEAFRELRRIRPDIRVILMSGYDEQDATRRFAGLGLAGFLHKPFTPQHLRATVLALLNRS